MFDIFGEMDMTIEKFFSDIEAMEEALEASVKALEEVQNVSR